MTPKRRNPAPPGLGVAGKRLWRNTFESYELNPTETVVLTEICHIMDEIGLLEAALASARSLTTKGSRGQVVAHPLLGELRQHRAIMRSLVRQLGLPDPVNAPVRKLKSGGRLVAVARMQRREDGA
jgi:hypothetical protein